MLFELFSKRRKRESGGYSDVYQYKDIPNQFRVQIVHMIQEAFASEGKYFSGEAKETIQDINNVLCREYGVFKLAGRHDENFNELSNFILQTEDYEKVLDAIELVFRYIDKEIRRNPHNYNRWLNVDSLISELNNRFKESTIGYQYESGEIIRVDSEFIHSEAVKPVLSLLNTNKYSAVNEEFLTAHEHYRHSRYEESATECLKSLESLLKTICTNRNWSYESKDTVKRLINIVLNEGLVPSFMQTQLNMVQALLESGIPTIRNKLAGHGQGPNTRDMPEYVASYALHLTATTLLFLANADSEE